MRPTLSSDDDVLAAARAIAEHQKRTIGEVVSELARRSLNAPVATTMRNGIPLLPVREGAGVATLEIVNALRDEMP